MKEFERSIKKAFDKVSGEIFEADDIFEVVKDGFKIREKFHSNKVELYCLECLQKLNVSTSKKDRLHFKHEPKAEFCELKDCNFSQEENKIYTDILVAKESQRHKDLKNIIGEKLKFINGINKDSIRIDNQFIVKNKEKRKPDVYCKYLGKEIVFEIQLSKLSLRYILSRYNFYKENGIYLIWILDNFDIHNQGQLERDIKYLAKYENFFHLDENAIELKLICQYKKPYLTEKNKIQTKWLENSVSFNQIKFDDIDCQIYYFDLSDNLKKIEIKKSEILTKIEENKVKQIEERRKSDADYYVNIIIAKIKDSKLRKVYYYNDIVELINGLDEYQLDILNDKLKISNRDKTKKPAINIWISTAKKEDNCFLNFILNCEKLRINVNHAEFEGKTIFQEIYLNKDINQVGLIDCILKKGYKITPKDDEFLSNLAKTDSELNNRILLYSFYKRLSNIELMSKVQEHFKLICIIESARLKKVIYHKLDWIAFANNAIHSYSQYWKYIEFAFKKYEIWDLLLEKDKIKKNFQKKLNTFYLNNPEQKNDFEEIYKELFPELQNIKAIH